MIKVKTIGAQGDVLFRRMTEVPDNATLQQRNGLIVVAHSETGHHHVIASPDVALLKTFASLICYLRLEGPFADVVHQRSFDTHETLRLLGDEGRTTYFEVRRQREHAPYLYDLWCPVTD